MAPSMPRGAAAKGPQNKGATPAKKKGKKPETKKDVEPDVQEVEFHAESSADGLNTTGSVQEQQEFALQPTIPSLASYQQHPSAYGHNFPSPHFQHPVAPQSAYAASYMGFLPERNNPVVLQGIEGSLIQHTPLRSGMSPTPSNITGSASPAGSGKRPAQNDPAKPAAKRKQETKPPPPFPPLKTNPVSRDIAADIAEIRRILSTEKDELTTTVLSQFWGRVEVVMFLATGKMPAFVAQDIKESVTRSCNELGNALERLNIARFQELKQLVSGLPAGTLASPEHDGGHLDGSA